MTLQTILDRQIELKKEQLYLKEANDQHQQQMILNANRFQQIAGAVDELEKMKSQLNGESDGV